MNAPLPSCHFPGSEETVRRFREAGDVTLDLCHRDGRVDAHWLGLVPREFALLWRLAQQPGEPVSAEQLLGEAWRVIPAPESASIAAHIAQMQAKLAPLGLAALIGRDGEGRYFLDIAAGSGPWHIG